MTARRFIIFLSVAALVLFCPACACAPDRWMLGAKIDRDPRTGQLSQQELNATISGPIPRLFHE